MKCPHCLNSIHTKRKEYFLQPDIEGDWVLEQFECPACKRFFFYLIRGQEITQGPYGVRYKLTNDGYEIVDMRMMVWPKGSSRPPVPPEVTEGFYEDYKEACLVLPDSPKASAALSRRSLQNLLRNKAGVKKSDLSNEIQELLDTNQLPSHIASDIDAIRNIGNFAAHPNKSKSTGEIVDVEPGEAEWNLDVLEMLFDHYFVLPEKSRLKKEQLNKKLQDLGKPPLK